MRKFPLLLAALCAFTPAAPAAAAELQADRGGQDTFRGIRQGGILPLNVIRQRIRIPGAVLIGVDLVGDGLVYRLRFMRGANVMIVDVDARTGRPLGCIGC
jgi:hypothetical protein